MSNFKEVQSHLNEITKYLSSLDHVTVPGVCVDAVSGLRKYLRDVKTQLTVILQEEEAKLRKEHDEQAKSEQESVEVPVEG